MVIYFLITCFSFFLFSKSLSLKSLPTWSNKELSFQFIINFIKNCLTKTSFNQTPRNSKSGETNEEISILDLPEHVLESVLEKLPPSSLYNMAGVCSSLREKCVSDYLWEKHLKNKWGKFLGPAVYRQWKLYIASRNEFCDRKYGMLNGAVLRTLSLIRRLCRVSPRNYGGKVSGFSPADSNMNCYLALETGKFWFPAQVYNRENGHLGFMLSCYDAEVSYDSYTNTFQARYPPHGRREISIEQNVSWERLRAPAVDAPPHDLYVSECLNDLKPGDHIEIQWKRKKEFPYGWWYGVVGHLESCEGLENHCYCHQSDTVVLEFNQYTPGSRWRCTTVNRKDHTEEEGNESYGLYGGIRKLKSKEEIAAWTQLWPNSILE